MSRRHSRRGGTARACGRALAALLVLAASAWADDPLEPPPESPEGEDYEIEPADSLEQGHVEVGFGASGRAGGGSRRSRSVRFADGALAGNVREGTGDPLAGGTVEGRAGGARVGAGKLAPRWGRGLVLGAASEPWSRRALDRGEGAAFRGRSGQGAWAAAGSRIRLEGLVGRFSRRDLAAARAEGRGVGLGLLADRSGGAQASLALEREGYGTELALDRAGRWRAEAVRERSLGPWSLAARARGGLAAFRPLAEPRRAGPAQALALAGNGPVGPLQVQAIGALWRFAPGLDGSRAALEVARRIHHHGQLAAGFEEQHGTRRPGPRRSGGFRQGAWGEWRGGPPGLDLTLRHEVWGERRLARDAVRTLSAARLEVRGPAGIFLRVTHWAWRTRRGESLYLPEAGSDRLTLRAVSGTGARTRIEVRAPGAGGWLHGAVNITAATERHPSGAQRPQWTLNWTRRARTATGRRTATRAP